MARSPDLRAGAFLRNNWHAIDQELGAGDDDFVSGLYAVQHDIVIADDLADLERLLMNHISAFLIGLRDKSEILAADPRHRYHRNHRLLLCAPNDAGPNKLGGAQAVV